MHKAADKPAQSAEALNFFKWALNNGQKLALDLDYVPLPASLVKLVEASWSEIKDASGKPVLELSAGQLTCRAAEPEYGSDRVVSHRIEGVDTDESPGRGLNRSAPCSSTRTTAPSSSMTAR